MSAQPAQITAQKARAAANALLSITTQQKQDALKRVGEELRARQAEILEANQKDVEAAKVEVAAGRLSSSLAARLSLSGGEGHPKFESMVAGVADVANLPDPTNQCNFATRLDDGLDLYRVSVPVGVLLVIFEARPEVLINVAALALKSSNAVILK
ncbi:Aldehyde/histidinol dehydrogenase, partial [Piptocephalis cylindrospora]